MQAKYLKKDIEYTLDFETDHLVKLEPGFDAEVTIYNDEGKKNNIKSRKSNGKI